MKLRLLVCSASLVFLNLPRLGAAANDDATALAVGRAYLKYQAELRAAVPKVDATTEGAWWKSTSSLPPTAAETAAKFSQAERDFRDAVRAATGTAVIPPGGPNMRLAFLPAEKQDVVARIETTYTERMGEIRRKSGNLNLAADTERVRSLAAERDKEMAAALTPDEFEMYQLRTSISSSQLRSRYGEAIESLDEFKKLFALQKAFDEKYSPEFTIFDSNLLRTRSEEERKLVDRIMAAVGPARAAAFRRAADQEYIALKALTRRLNLPDNTPDTVMELRDNYAGVSMAINNQGNLNPMDRRSLIQDVEKEARQKLIELLGKEGFDAYLPRNNWLRYLESGQAFSSDPKDAAPGQTISATMGVFPVYPTGTVFRTSPTGGTIISTSPTPLPAGFTAPAISLPAVSTSPNAQPRPAIDPQVSTKK